MANERDAAEFDEASHWPDPAAACDTLEDHVKQAVADLWPKKWPMDAKPRLARFVSVVVRTVLRQGVEELGVLDVRRIEGRELMAMVLAEIMHAEDPLLIARCIDFTLETGVLGLTQTEIAALHGVTKATASHHCVNLKETLRGGKPASGMKSAKAVESYRATRTGRSSRSPVVEWSFAETFKKSYAKAAA